MANRSTKKSLERFKYEVADELGVPLSNGYNGDLTAKQNGSVGGYMVKKMIEAQEDRWLAKEKTSSNPLVPMYKRKKQVSVTETCLFFCRNLQIHF